MGQIKVSVYTVALALVAGAGCASETEAPTGNEALGIARFQTTDTADRTSVVGLDDTGREVARLDMVHGRFALSGLFREDYPTAEVVGRKLDVSLHGTPHLVWETEGFEPVLNLPAHPANETELAAFLADEHVTAILERWQIRFAPMAARSDEVSYTTGSYSGTFVANCTGATTCGSVRSTTINMCGGGAASNMAVSIARTSPDDEVLIGQCCPPYQGGSSTDWFAVKSCPTTSANDFETTCGHATSGACRSCPAYATFQDAHGYCEVYYYGGSLNYTYLPTCTTASNCSSLGDYGCYYGMCYQYSYCPDSTPCLPGDTCYGPGDWSVCPA